MSTFGSIFRVTTFGESHCKAVGAVVDGVPPCMKLTEADIQPQLTRRRPGQSRLTTPRDEKDLVTILSGTECGYTLGTSVGLVVMNEDQRPGDYKEMDTVPRPGHADFTYQIKMGTRASSGGGRSSARETIGRVAAGAIAEKWLRETYGTTVSCWVRSVGSIYIPDDIVPEHGWTREEVDKLGTLRVLRDPVVWREVPSSEEPDAKARKKLQVEIEIKAEESFLAVASTPEAKKKPCYQDSKGVVYNLDGEVLSDWKDGSEELKPWQTDELIPSRCPHPPTACRIASLVREVKSKNDSIGGTLSCVCTKVPPALGEPVFDRLEAMLAHAMLSLPATKGFEIGSGFAGTAMRGSQHNDCFVKNADTSEGAPAIATASNFAGGTLGGITSGADLFFNVAIKPVSTIGQAQTTSTYDGSECVLEAKGRHDPCVLPRAPPLVEGMAALVLIDAALMQRTRLGGCVTTRCDGSQPGVIHEALAARRAAADESGEATTSKGYPPTTA
mmetsp:Transcript_81215/g.226083  ORF Transcript_81215/g.226083 Transcript_81215/m.226083 type:complete len:501 (+) Transcript_81215:74-1576(+)|eukprot:CAMPEP_0117482466 /NCGR_PEP_ID=MMETSP0784-20121206/13434_1 /TAXON_ID=39447 /ORGANISM="" /LENGTH=500 /DNA_ID=CAMNT_0005276963 /DNA_START=49 /DNA_END=1551 /DNA_ORIENTATION=-